MSYCNLLPKGKQSGIFTVKRRVLTSKLFLQDYVYAIQSQDGMCIAVDYGGSNFENYDSSVVQPRTPTNSECNMKRQERSGLETSSLQAQLTAQTKQNTNKTYSIDHIHS